MRQLKNSGVVITGASSGIGMAAALAFSDQGARLVLAARNQEALKKVAAKCNSAVAVPTDVTDPQAMKDLAKAAADVFGGNIDVWINNAGIGAIGGFAETPIEAHDQVIRTNLMGYVHGAHAVLPYFLRQQRGILINTNSIGGWVPAPYSVAYAASKFGLRGFSQALRGELKRWPDIHVCDLFPAFIDTPGFHHAANYAGREFKPMPPLYDARDVARAMVSLAMSPRDSLTVGGSATIARIAYSLFPSWLIHGFEGLVRHHLTHGRPTAKTDGNLFAAPADEPCIDGGWRSERSAVSPVKVGAIVVGGMGLGLLLSQQLRSRAN